MDLLFKRYASPFVFLNGMIQAKRFSEFVDEFVKTIHEEKEEKTKWEYFLHRVFDKSFNEFKEEIKVNQDNQNMSDSQIEATVLHSNNILKNFNPETQGV